MAAICRRGEQNELKNRFMPVDPPAEWTAKPDKYPTSTRQVPHKYPTSWIANLPQYERCFPPSAKTSVPSGK